MKNNISVKAAVFILNILICTSSISANEYGLPNLINYPKNLYNAGNQNWAISQDETGVMFFGNTYGTLIFDGNRWVQVPVPNHSVVRALLPISDHRMLVGAFDDFGSIRLAIMYLPVGLINYPTASEILEISGKSMNSTIFCTCNQIHTYLNSIRRETISGT